MSYLQTQKQDNEFESGLAEMRETKEKLEDECDFLKSEIEKRREEIAVLEKQATENAEEFSQLQEKKKELQELFVRERNLEERIEKIRTDIGNILYAVGKEKQRNEQLQSEVNGLKEAGDRHDQDLKAMEEQAAANQREIDDLTMRIRETNRRYRCPCEIM